MQTVRSRREGRRKRRGDDKNLKQGRLTLAGLKSVGKRRRNDQKEETIQLSRDQVEDNEELETGEEKMDQGSHG